MSNGFSFPSELIYIIIIIILVAIITVLAAKVTAQDNQIKYYLSRRNSRKPEQKQPAEETRPAMCNIFCNYRDIVIPDLEASVAYWKTEYVNAENRCSIAQDTIRKLRTGRESGDVQGN